MNLRHAWSLGRELMTRHGIEHWTLTFDGAKRRAGLCRHDAHTLSISRHITALHSEEQVRDTLLHEIAHALVGPRAGHNATWRRKAVEIGGNGDRCLSAGTPAVAAPWVGTCPAGHEHDRFRRPSRPISCTRCEPSFSVGHLFEWQFHGSRVAMGPAYERSVELSRQRQETEQALRAFRGPAAPRVLPPGAVVVLAGTGRYAGVSGRIVKRGRTRYHVRTSLGLVTAPFAIVIPLEASA